MRLLAYLTLLIMLAAAGWAGQVFWQEWQAHGRPSPIRIAAQTQEAVAPENAHIVSVRSWPAVFGEPSPPEPPKAPAPAKQEEPQPPAPKSPPLASMGYELKGVIQIDGAIWAMVSHASGQQVFREGDEMREGLFVARIDEQGLWAGPEGGDPELLGFPE